MAVGDLDAAEPEFLTYRNAVPEIVASSAHTPAEVRCVTEPAESARLPFLRPGLARKFECGLVLNQAVVNPTGWKVKISA